MICENCGTEINTEPCYNCGHVSNSQSSVPQGSATSSQNYRGNATGGFLSEESLSSKNGLSAFISAGDWFKLWGIGFLLNLVPVVGSIASIVYYIVLLCRENTAASIRSYIKFKLILSIAVLIFAILFFLVFYKALIFRFNSKVMPTTSTKVPSMFELQ